MDSRLVLFDLGGVLSDLGKPATQMGLDITNEQFWSLWLSLPEVRSFESGALDTEKFLEILAATLNVPDPPEQFRRRFMDWQLGLYPGMLDILEVVARQRDIALLSNTNELHWSMIQSEANLADVFKHVFLSFELGCCKPDDVIFERVLELVSLSPSQILYLDDSAKNVEVAERFGIPAVRVQGPAEVRACLRVEGIALNR